MNPQLILNMDNGKSVMPCILAVGYFGVRIKNPSQYCNNYVLFSFMLLNTQYKSMSDINTNNVHVPCGGGGGGGGVIHARDVWADDVFTTSLSFLFFRLSPLNITLT